MTAESVLEDLGVDGSIHRCEWRADLEKGRVPATHALRDKLIGKGFDGVIYPSFMSPGGTCIALWRWNMDGVPRLEVVDPERRLPTTPASWV